MCFCFACILYRYCAVRVVTISGTGLRFQHTKRIAIDRTSRHNVVEQTIQHFATHPQLIVGLMPEGTRKRAGIPVKEWKTGFYYIAKGVQVPILPIYIDNPGKRVIFGPSLMPTGDLAADLATLQQFYRNDRV